MKKIISILGSTGSIGLNTLEIYNKKKKLFKINILAANKNYKLICKQIKTFKPEVFIVNDQNIYKKVKKKFRSSKVKIFQNIDIKKRYFKYSDITVAAIPGIAGLYSTLEMIKKSKKILIANKESVICGWNLIKKVADKSNTKIIPVDSEHFSIMQLLKHHKLENIEKVYLTASGGPFLQYSQSKFKNIKPSDAIKHPKWKMGKKISVDSATLMNKILEVAEAHKFFSIDSNKIEIIIHPESLVHAIVEFKNGLYKFIYHETTMLVPIANAIFDKDLNIEKIIKFKSSKNNSFNFQKLNFQKVDKKKFPIIRLKDKINSYESSPIIINAANEILVDHFLNKKLQFLGINKIIMSVLNDRNYKKYAIRKPKNINQIIKIDEWARETAKKHVL